MLQASYLSLIDKNCKYVVNNCKGSLEVIYGQNGNSFYFIASSRLQNNKGKF